MVCAVIILQIMSLFFFYNFQAVSYFVTLGGSLESDFCDLTPANPQESVVS